MKRQKLYNPTPCSKYPIIHKLNYQPEEHHVQHPIFSHHLSNPIVTMRRNTRRSGRRNSGRVESFAGVFVLLLKLAHILPELRDRVGVDTQQGPGLVEVPQDREGDTPEAPDVHPRCLRLRHGHR